jgi:hypothetical protein
LACHLQIDADPEPFPDPAYHFDADPDPYFLFNADSDPDADSQYCQSLFSINTEQPDTVHRKRSIKSLERNCVSSNRGAAQYFI